MLHRWRRGSGGTLQAKMEAHSSPEARGKVFFFFLRLTLTPLQQRIRGPGVVASGARFVRRKPGKLVIQRKI